MGVKFIALICKKYLNNTQLITAIIIAYQDASKAVLQAKQKGDISPDLFTARKHAAQKLLAHEGAHTIFQKCSPQKLSSP